MFRSVGIVRDGTLNNKSLELDPDNKNAVEMLNKFK
jgi:hypothetical protein